MILAWTSLSSNCERSALSRLCRWLCLLVSFAGLIPLDHAMEFGERVGPVELLTLDGRSLTMSNYAERRGTVVLFLSARDRVAGEEMRVVSELSSRLRRRDILFVGVFPNARETSDEVRRFAQSEGLLFPIYRDPEGKAARQFGAQVTPEVFLLDAQRHAGLSRGRRRHKRPGFGTRRPRPCGWAARRTKAGAGEGHAHRPGGAEAQRGGFRSARWRFPPS